MKLEKLEAIVDSQENAIYRVDYIQYPNVRAISSFYGKIDMARKPFGFMIVSYGTGVDDYVLLHYDQVRSINRVSA